MERAATPERASRPVAAPPRRRVWRWAALSASVGAGVWLGTATFNFLVADNTELPPPPAQAVAIRAQGLRSFVVRRQGQILWQFSARSIDVGSNGTWTLAHGVDPAVLYQNGQPYVRLTAPEVHLNNMTNELEARGGIAATGPDGFAFSAPYVHWSYVRSRLDCSQNVQARVRNLFFNTPQLTYTLSPSIITCPQPVTVVGNGISLRGGGLRIDVKKRVVHLTGGCEMIFDPHAPALPGLPSLAGLAR